MKKLLLGLVATGFMIGSVGMVFGVAEEGVSKEDRKEEHRKRREARKAERKHNRSKEAKCLAKEERNAELKAQAQASKEKHERRRLEHKAKQRQQKERDRAHCEQRKQANEQLLKKERIKRHVKADNVRAFRANREVLIDKWAQSHKMAVDHARGEGKYAFLYKSPAWPIYAQYFEGGKHLFNIDFKYQYACDCYNSTGGGSKSNITKLAFGESPITFDEILLAKKLLTQGKVVHAVNPLTNLFYAQTAVPPITVLPMRGYASWFENYNQPLSFRGKEEKYDLDFELSRYIVNNTIAVGVQLPVRHNKHRLEVVIPSSGNTFEADFTDVAALKMFDKVLLAKGITELGGSAAGLGDVSAFINAQINSFAFDKLVVGVRGQFPTGKKATAKKLWAPELGNGGWTEFALFGSSLVSYAKYLNLHLMLEASFSLPAHLDRRLPRWVEFTNTNPAEIVNTYLTNNAMETIAFGERVYTVQNAEVAAYDTTIKSFGDHAVRAKITKGAEFKLRLGNMFERFILTKGFLDMFYDFRAKQKDSVSDVNTQEYNTSVLRDHTQELEHRIGFEYSYQFDLKTRLRLGTRYTFAGMNVPKTFEVSCAMNYAF